MADTEISWTDKVWNVTRGCRRISPGCGGARGEGGCYAERQAYRFSGPGQAYEGLVKLTANGPRWTGVGRFAVDKLGEPLTWRKPERVFVDSMSDLFFEEFSNEQIAAVFGVMAACPQHTFQCLTKRPKRMREWFAWLRGPSEETFTMQQRGIAAAPNTSRALLDAAYEYLGKARKPELDAAWKRLEDDPWPLPNVWLGVSTENQETYVERVRDLHFIPAAVHFISAEPLLGPIDMRADCINPGWLDWVIAGCESGHGARRCDVAWLRSLRDQCATAGVPFFLKQAQVETVGVVAPTSAPPEIIRAVSPTDRTRFTDVVNAGPGSKRKAGGVIELPYLDGVQHAAFPEVP